MMSLEEIVNDCLPPTMPSTAAVLIERLTAREDAICEILRLAGVQFGMMPGLVSGVIMQVGLGTPPTDDERSIIQHQFDESIAELQRMIEQHFRDNDN